MAKKSKKSSAKSSPASAPNVVRIKASESAPKKSADKEKTAKVTKASEVVVVKPVKTEKAPRTRKVTGLSRPFVAIWNYFSGAWYELRQVRWPNRRATWSLTGAVLAYSAFFVVLVLLLDAAFKYLFELILGK